MTDTTALTSVINELVSSERSYVRRLQILKNDYADPLRSFARNKDTAILPAYEAKTLFGNIDNLLPINEAFLTDLERMMSPHGPKTVGGVGDVALRHFKELRGFEQYKQYYIKREEAQAIFEREVSKRSSRFGAYIDVCACHLMRVECSRDYPAHKVSIDRCAKSHRPSRTSHGACAENTAVYTSLPYHAQAYGSRRPSASQSGRSR